MKTYQIIIVDGAGSHTIKIDGRSLRFAIPQALQSLPWTNAGILSVTATIL